MPKYCDLYLFHLVILICYFTELCQFFQLTEMVQENAMLKGKLVTVNEMLSNVECETKASRETIMRLVSEMGREQKISSRYTTELENLRVVSFRYYLLS